MMRVRRMRFDLFICFFIAVVIFYGLMVVGEKLNVINGVERVVSQVLDSRIQDVPNGEVGGYATEETPRAKSAEDLALLMSKNETFTVEVNAIRYYNMGIFAGDNYEWRILKLDDGSCFAVRLNTDKIIEGEDKNILPVGRLVASEPEALEKMKRAMENVDGTFYSDVYIDMDGEGNATGTGASFTIVKMLGWCLIALASVGVLVALVLTVFGIHRIFVKCKLFPPIFPGGKW